MGKIVLSYRRDDSKTITNWLYEKLVDRYGKDSVFRDIDSIQPTENFKKRIGRALKDCDFVVAVIGPGWHGPVADGQSRINSTNDWVRVEIETALQLDIPLLPVLVEEAEMPDPEGLPASLREITEINALPIASGGQRFYDDLNRLFATIESVTRVAAAPLPRQPKPEPQPQPYPEPKPQPQPQPQPQPASQPEPGPSATTTDPPPVHGPRHTAPPERKPRPEGVWGLFEGRTILLFIAIPAIVMTVFWLYAFATMFATDEGSISVFTVSGIVMLGLGIAIKRKAKMRFHESLIVGAVVGAPVLIAVMATGYVEAEAFAIGFGVFVVGGAAATAAGFALAAIPWAHRPPAA
jgi:hypothetical protein